MTHLKDIQLAFQAYLQHEHKSPFIEGIVDSKPMTAERRIKVYYECYRLRLHEVLQIDYPKIEKLLGEPEFYETALSYIDHYPSHYFSVRYFGKDFDKFLQETKPYSEYPFLAEMANFEWSLMDSLDAENAPSMTMKDLTQVPADQWAELSFTFHPSVHIRSYHWDTPALWKHIDQKGPARAPKQLDQTDVWIFWHKDLRSKFESMNEIQQNLYQSIQEGLTFSEMAERLCDILPEQEVPKALLQHIQYWIEQGLFQTYSISRSSE